MIEINHRMPWRDIIKGNRATGRPREMRIQSRIQVASLCGAEVVRPLVQISDLGGEHAEIRVCSDIERRVALNARADAVVV
jgi:hypothetical protein